MMLSAARAPCRTGVAATAAGRRPRARALVVRRFRQDGSDSPPPPQQQPQQQATTAVVTAVGLSPQEEAALLPQPPSQPPATLVSIDSLDLLAAWSESYQMPDEMSLWDDDDHYSSRRELSLAYSPPKSDLPGLAVAVSLIVCWSAMFQHGMWGYSLSDALTLPHVLDGAFTFMALEFLSAGLFITTHDSMHGAITPNNRFLNNVLGATCVSLYAWFDYSLMWTKHWEHHNLCGTPKEDPDFHQGDPALLPWFASFMGGYVSPQQVLKLFSIITVMALLGAPIPNQLVFWAAPGLVSALRLFYFGTFIPHRPRKGATEVMAWAKARSVDHAPPLLSFLQCYNFGFHWEHHRWPFAPWWDLPRARAVRYTAMGSLDD